MATFLEKAIRLTGKGFDIERRKLMPPNSYVALLARDGRQNIFHELRYFDKWFITRSNNFRTGFYVEIATTADLQADILKCSHFAINSVCYAVGEGDVFPPSGDRFSWMLYGKFVKNVYTRQI